MPAAAQQTVPEIPFDSVPNFLKLPPDLYLGEPSGVAVNSKGHVFVFSRGGTSTGPPIAETAAQLLEFAPDGKYMREIGKNLYAWSFAHAVRIDPHDNIWAVDKGSDMIVKFNPEGRVMLVSGRKQEASDEDTAPLKHPKPPLPAQDGRFRQPTDVTWDPQGNTYISDGYINSRVAKLDKDGNWVDAVGRARQRPRPVQHRRTASPPTRRATSMSPTAATAASRCSTARASSCARSPSTCRTRRRAHGDRQHASPIHGRHRADPAEARRAVGDVHHARRRISCSTPPTPSPAASTS